MPGDTPFIWGVFVGMGVYSIIKLLLDFIIQRCYAHIDMVKAGVIRPKKLKRKSRGKYKKIKKILNIPIHKSKRLP